MDLDKHSKEGRQQEPSVVLVIDDEPKVLSTIQMCLRSCGWHVEGISDARLGMETAQRLKPAVILCDATMPYLSGSELILALKTNPQTGKVPIILMTGDADPTRYMGVPYDRLLSKPFQVPELRAAVREQMGTRAI